MGYTAGRQGCCAERKEQIGEGRGRGGGGGESRGGRRCPPGGAQPLGAAQHCLNRRHSPEDSLTLVTSCEWQGCRFEPCASRILFGVFTSYQTFILDFCRSRYTDSLRSPFFASRQAPGAIYAFCLHLEMLTYSLD